MTLSDIDAGATALTAWWRPDQRSRAASSVFGNVSRIRQRQQFRFAQDMLHLQLYADLRYVGFGPRGVLRSWEDVYDGMMSRNLVRRICETMHARIVKTRPQPRLDTDGASYELQEQADLRSKYLLGLWQREKVFPKRQQDVMHSILTGTGALKLYDDGKRVRFDVAPSWEIWVDTHEGRYAQPRTLYQIRAYDREHAMALWPSAKKAIERAPVASSADDWATYSADTSADMVLLTEGWHLGVEDEDDEVKGGRHILCCDSDDGVIEHEAWDWPWFPFVFTRCAWRPFGFWGVGIPEIIAGSQLEIERVRKARYEAYARWMPVTLVERGSKIVRSTLSNILGSIVEYTGIKPEIWNPEPVPQGWYTHEATEAQAMYETAGVSQLSAAGVKPAGLDSGKALRTYDDLEASGLIALARDDEEAMVELAEKTFAIESSIAQRATGKRIVRYQDTDSIQDIDWSEVDMPPGSYSVRVAPVSALSNTFAGRLEDVYELKDLGLVTDPDEMAELIQIPDLRKRTKRHASHRRLLQIVVESTILGHGVYVEPEPTWDLQLGFTLARDALMDSETRYYRGLRADDSGWTDEQAETFEDRHELLRQFIEACVVRARAAGQPWALATPLAAESGQGLPPPGVAPPMAAPVALPPVEPAAPPGAPLM